MTGREDPEGVDPDPWNGTDERQWTNEHGETWWIGGPLGELVARADGRVYWGNAGTVDGIRRRARVALGLGLVLDCDRLTPVEARILRAIRESRPVVLEDCLDLREQGSTYREGTW